MALWQKITYKLGKTAEKIGGQLRSIFNEGKIDEQSLVALEDLLIMADVGPQIADELIQEIKQNAIALMNSEDHTESIRNFLVELIYKRIVICEKTFEIGMNGTPEVVVVLGVNGAGKTTTIGKLAAGMKQDKRKVLIGAGDTFRAAGANQMRVWAERVGVDFIEGEHGSDAAALAYNACQKARDGSYDVLFIDTAGRLHNKQNLMDELKKISRVVAKQIEHAPHQCLLVLDATTGQNALRQVEEFLKFQVISGLIITKLDSTARAGILIALAHRFALPVYFVGFGEKVEDLQPFNARQFAYSLLK